jgi:hypothetical protein
MELQTVVDTSSEGIGIKASSAQNIRALIHAAGVQATQEIFNERILPEAKSLCPVGTPPDDPHPGKNRDSIKLSFRDKEETGWVSAWIYTESGYGWLVEHGTSHNRALTRTATDRRHGRKATQDRTPAQPYIMPAMINHCAEIAERQKEILESL